MASNDTTTSSQGFQSKVLDVLREPERFPPEMASWIRAQIVRNPLVKMDAFQLPTLDRKHNVGNTGEAFFLNGWSSYVGVSGYEGASFYQDNDSRVFLQGMVVGGTVGATIFTLPPSYRPVGQLLFPVLANGVLQTLAIQSSGNVILIAGSNVNVSLSGVSFRSS